MYNKELVTDLKSLGLRKGDIVLMHSSLKGLNYKITPSEVIDSVLDVIGEQGTLLLPAFSYLFVTDEQIEFNLLTTPSCIGAIPEYFRVNYPCKRSLHPTHSLCAIGKDACMLTHDHNLDSTPVGENSPINKAISMGGKILMLGCSLLTSTFMHGIEEKIGVHYCLKKDPVVRHMIDEKGEKHTMLYYPHNLYKIIQRYDRLENVLTSDCMKKDKLLNGFGILVNGKKAVEIATNILKQDEMYFVERE